jgi:hypothetical protein
LAAALLVGAGAEQAAVNSSAPATPPINFRLFISSSLRL